MLKKSLLIFMGLCVLLTFLAIRFVQSETFADILKDLIKTHLPVETGVEIEFTAFDLHYFPPGISIVKPDLRFLPGGRSGLGETSRIVAERMDFLFYPFQMLTGTVQISEVRMLGGNLDLDILSLPNTKKSSKKSSSKLNLKDLLNVKVEAVSLENSRVSVRWNEGKDRFSARVNLLSLSQSLESTQAAPYGLTFSIEDPKSNLIEEGKVLKATDVFEGDFRITPNEVTVQELSFRSGKTNFVFEGIVRGDIFSPKSLSLDLAFRSVLDGPWLHGWLKTEKEITGTLETSGLIQGPLGSFPDSLTGKIETIGNDLRYGDWPLGKLSLVGSLSKDAAHLQELVLEAPRRERSGGLQPGEGGVVRIKDARFSRTPGGTPDTVPLELEGAHLQWLLRPVINDIYGLDFRVNGKANAQIVRVKDHWTLTADTDLDIPRFKLDNQKYGQNKKLRNILDIPKMKIDGKIEAVPGKLMFQSVRVRLPKTDLKVGGGVGGGDGLWIDAAGTADFNDIGTIAENKIKGVGQLQAKIHGPTSRVFLDFYPDLKEAEYLNIRFGDLKGKITWDEHPSDLLIEGALAKRGRTALAIGGKVALGKTESIDIVAETSDGDLRDLSEIAGYFHEDLWWFPASMSGRAAGSIRVSGKPGLSALKVDFGFSGKYWTLYGERFQSGHFQAGYDSGDYFVKEFQASKGDGGVTGSVFYSKTKSLNWELRANGFQLRSLDLIAHLDLPIHGKFTLESSGSGVGDGMVSRTVVSARDVQVRGVPYGNSEATFETEKGIAKLHGVASGNQALVDLVYPLKPGIESSLKVEMRDFDFSPALLLLNPKLIREDHLVGRASGLLSISFRSGLIERSNGSLSLQDFRIEKSGLRLGLNSRVESPVRDGSFMLRDLVFHTGEREGRMNLKSDRGELDGVVSGSTDLSLVSLVTSAVESADGEVKLDGRIRGTLKDPKVFGRLSVESGVIRSSVLPSQLENVSGIVRIQQNLIFADGITADLASGRTTLQGYVKLLPSLYPELSLQLGLSNTRLKIYPFQFVKTSGNLTITGNKAPYRIAGTVRSDQGLIREKVMGGKQQGGRRSSRFAPPPTSWAEEVPLFDLLIHAESDGGILVKNDLFDAELRGKVDVIHTIEVPRIQGWASVRQGKLTFKDRIFNILSGEVEFDNPAIINPKFSLLAATEVDKVNIHLFAQGRMDDFHVEFSSTPSYPESEIISLLARGYTTGDVQRRRSGDLGYAQQGEAASVLLHSFDFNRDVQEKTGLQIEVNEAQETRSGNSIFRPQDATVGGGSSPRIVIRRQLGKRFQLSFASTVGVGNGSEKEVSAEVKMTPALSFIGVWNSFEGNSAGTGTSATEIQESYGVDLKVQKRFK